MRLQRNFRCGELTAKDVGKEVTLCGWVENYRDHGGIIFIDLTDRWGLAQIVFDPEVCGKEIHDLAGGLRSQFVIAAKGTVRLRPEGMANPKLATGEIEVYITDMEILNKSKTPPFEALHAEKVNDETRLKYRYIDLRNPAIRNCLVFRSKLMHAIREYFYKNDFVEVETPILNKSTPEGARDYLVPSRVREGCFYALPQSPQLFKQILMTAGFDRYIQIAKCFRDEDLRADRQPEFTQVDMEMSFITQDDIIAVVEGLFKELFKEFLNIDLKLPLPRMTYQEAMLKYGCDKPDLRFGLEIKELSDVFANTEFSVFKNTLAKKGKVRGISVISSLYLDEAHMYDAFTKIDFYYDSAVASVKVGRGVKSEGSLVISGTEGYIYVPAPWWKTDYFEARYENQENNKRYFYQLDGEGIRYELVAFLKAIKDGRHDYYISDEVSERICGVISDFYQGKTNILN